MPSTHVYTSPNPKLTFKVDKSDEFNKLDPDNYSFLFWFNNKATVYDD